ncbi:DNA polymerase III subunit gamma/tau [Lactococcus formosensis]|jgi:DNA polymerase III, subunit gamma and tau|uniref:DNA-directed DNA polymerase n=1 Tax=Lactococcus formosensis TaxID=1281486 RepID=A0A9X4PL72_9LACT|nr:DNA polymerase III subunit gamma/tau [Lactococcus formosensis]MDG6120558.1 DNA polymerase III subunit gamma/tau [Lactococcus formosensis]MDG6143623.1 DNA polymerase III subunit gamma/tau [Lactococcus formosensis]MDG6156705.1 DNA polymerase III subunit gamma/tau [Lactococcus formosensis]MDG6160933.1 DNA polymerase III subunit gamma/tau [Lactococcus formosensis]MDG6167228.1 DNA polymerase III subunit gamma/tau [Lactococcus formosensis]
MAYQALYRKYRSQRFDEMVGQEVVATTLKNAIVNGQISHAYLFSGPRGTGKTSAAKIFAKAINCPNQKEGEPCNTCDICQAITQGSLEDVIELDAASNNGVDEIREIRDKSTYAASRATYKVYIIDEVHMLSTGAFNALLKTLEEPTDNVVFVLATTELQKIPATIISRVQRFAFKAITTQDIRQHLAEVLADEKIEFEDAALDVIAKSAEGGMRDALSLLDQALSFSDGQLAEKDALLVTGSIANEALISYVAALAASDGPTALDALEKIFLEGKNMLRFTEDLLTYFRDLLLKENNEIPRPRLYQWINIAIESLKIIKETTQSKIAADVMTMRLVDTGAYPSAEAKEVPESLNDELQALKAEVAALKAKLAETGSQTVVSTVSQEVQIKQQVKTKAVTEKYTVNQDLVFKALKEATNEARQAVFGAWPEIVSSFTKPSDRAIINNTAPVAASSNFVVVTFPHGNLAKRVTENENLQLTFGNLMSSILGFSPEIIALAEQDWQALRQEYVLSLKKGGQHVTKDTESEPESEEKEVLVSKAKEFFGEKVKVIND